MGAYFDEAELREELIAKAVDVLHLSPFTIDEILKMADEVKRRLEAFPVSEVIEITTESWR